MRQRATVHLGLNIDHTSRGWLRVARYLEKVHPDGSIQCVLVAAVRRSALVQGIRAHIPLNLFASVNIIDGPWPAGLFCIALHRCLACY